MRTLALLGVALLLCGCGRYQLETAGNTVWRLDTRTGALEACGFEQAKPVCHPFPPPK